MQELFGSLTIHWIHKTGIQGGFAHASWLFMFSVRPLLQKEVSVCRRWEANAVQFRLDYIGWRGKNAAVITETAHSLIRNPVTEYCI